MSSPEPQLGVRAALAGLLVNLALAGGKIATGILGHSYALVADGIESMADIVSSLVVMGGLHLSARPADAGHPYGHGKAEPLAAAVVALLLLLAGAWIGVASIREIRVPHHAPAWFTLPVLAIVIGVKEWLSRRVMQVGRSLGSSAVRGDAWHHRSDAITSAAAFVGISVALIGGPGFEPADDWAALVACVVILANGFGLLREAIDELMDASVQDDRLREIRSVAGTVEGVIAIEKCRVRKVGLGLAMDIHVTVNGNDTVRRGHAIAHRVKDRLLGCGQRIVDVTVHVEPDDLGLAPSSAPPNDAMPGN